MKTKLSVSVWLSLLTVSVSALAVDSSVFRYEAPLTGAAVGEHSPVRVTLSASVLRHAQQNFSDLRLYDNENREAPYVVYPDVKPAEFRRETKLEVVKFEDLPNHVSRITLKCPPGWASEGVIINADAHDFEKNVKVETSADGQRWQPHGEGVIYDYTSRVDLRNVSVEFPKTGARYLRLTLSDTKPADRDAEQVELQYKDLTFRSGAKNTAPFSIREFLAWQGQAAEKEFVLEPAPLTVTRAADTYYELKPDDLRLVKIELDIATQYFYRRALLSVRSTGSNEERPIADETIYRLPNKAKPNTTLTLSGRRPGELVLWIFDNDSEPLTISGATGYYIRQNLYFIPEAGKSYRLCLGSDRAQVPRYDLQNILPADSDALAAATAWQLGEVTANTGYQKNFFADATDNSARLFQILVLLMVGGLGYWAWSTLKKVK